MRVRVCMCMLLVDSDLLIFFTFIFSHFLHFKLIYHLKKWDLNPLIFFFSFFLIFSHLYLIYPPKKVGSTHNLGIHLFWRLKWLNMKENEGKKKNMRGPFYYYVGWTVVNDNNWRTGDCFAAYILLLWTPLVAVTI